MRGAFWAVVPESVLKIYTLNGRMYEFRMSYGLQWETVDGVTTMSGWTLEMVQTFAEITGNSIPAGNVADNRPDAPTRRQNFARLGGRAHIDAALTTEVLEDMDSNPMWGAHSEQFARPVPRTCRVSDPTV